MFRDREDAGRRLASLLAEPGGPLTTGEDSVVVAILRDGAPVAAPISRRLGLPMDVVSVRRLVPPAHPSFVIGAIVEVGGRADSTVELCDEVIRDLRVTAADVDAVRASTRSAADRELAALLARGLTRPGWRGRTAIVVDDGVATGLRMRAACRAVRATGATRVVAAVPVAPPAWAADLGALIEAGVAVRTPIPFLAISQWYDTRHEVDDDELVRLLGIDQAQ